MALDFSRNGYETTFKNALSEGISLFCGAGFSVESFDSLGNRLPVGDGLLVEMKKVFPEIEKYSSLPRACTKIKNTEKELFYDFLQNRFTVGNFNPLYMSLLNISIKNIYTTNIDDLFFKIFNQIDRTIYLSDLSMNGDTYNDENAIRYFPLHGCVRNQDEYVFGATEIASAFSLTNNRDSWKSLANDARNSPILFWGWNFSDSGPIEAMYGNNNNIEDNTNRWVLLYNPDEETIDYLSSLKFNIIVGSTLEMLQYLSDDFSSSSRKPYEEKTSIDKKLKKYEIPKNDNNLPSYPLSSFFIDYTPRWSQIFSNNIPKTIAYKKVSDLILKGNDIIVVGIRSSGKTTLMMQLLADFKTSCMKHYMVAPSLQQAQVYIKLLNGRKSLLFIDDAFRDTDAIIELFNQKNIQVVCLDRDFHYERQYHRIQFNSYELIDITEIEKEDAQSIINIIPNELRRKETNNKKFDEDPTIISVLATHLKSINFKFIDNFNKQDPEATKVFLMISYVHACGTPCSFDMVYSFLGDDTYTWKQMYDIIHRIGKLIKDVTNNTVEYDIEESLQDYYVCRSRYFAEKILSNLPNGSEVFGEVLNDFALYVPAYKICMYDKFKRNAYDAGFVLRAFKNTEEGENFYNLCKERDNSEYIYQQAALYFSKKKEYKKAFNWIDMARNLSHYNRFSIDSTYSQIYFDANVGINEEQAINALDILSECCSNDKRKSIHFMAFAKRALRFFHRYNDDRAVQYVKKAISFIIEGLDSSNLSLSNKNKRELKNIKNELEKALKTKIEN